jgi:AraC-like DNA-binding protein
MSQKLRAVQVLAAYSRAVTGVALHLPPGEGRWRPKPAPLRSLISLHDDAIRLTAAVPRVAENAKAANGLEQQLIHGLVECLAVETVRTGSAVQEHQARIMLRFEESLRAGVSWKIDIPDICAAIDVPGRTLRAYCQAQLGMAPSRYIQLRRLQMTHRALWTAGPEKATVSAVARRYGFDALGRFAAVYREQFGELPSTTLRDSSGH